MSESPTSWRLILDPPQDGFYNMARDEALLECCRRGGACPGTFPVLRIYGWTVPTLSLGRFQDALQAADAVVIDSIRIPVDVVEAYEAS